MTTPVRPTQCVGAEFDTTQPPTLRIKGPMQGQPWPYQAACQQQQINGLMVDRSSPNGVGLWADPVNWAAFPTNRQATAPGFSQSMVGNASIIQTPDFSFTLTNTTKFPQHVVLTTTFLARGVFHPGSWVGMKLWYTTGALPTVSQWLIQPYRDSRYSPNSGYGPNFPFHLTAARTRTIGMGPGTSRTMQRIMSLYWGLSSGSGTPAATVDLYQVVTTGYLYVPRPADFMGDGRVAP